VGVAARQTDTGAVTVTSRRVVFVGRSRREWAFGRLTGIAHTASGQTLMRVSNRMNVSGLAFAPDVVPGFRFHLAVARADAVRDRAGLVARLEAQVDEHQALRPAPPAPAGVEQAPASARFGAGVLTAIAASVVLLVSLCCAGTIISGGGNEAGLSTPDSGALASPSPPGSRPSPARPSPSPSALPESTPESTPAGADTGRETGPVAAAAPAGDCAAYADADGWCVAGVSDYDCAGGSGNGPGYAPEGVRVVEPGRDPFGLDRDGDGEGCEPARAPAPPPPANPPPPPANPPPPPADGTDPRFGTCAEAKANGYGPYRSGETEYGWYRDADGDGVVCE
jgi:Excalibur calcium-binding domain